MRSGWVVYIEEFDTRQAQFSHCPFECFESRYHLLMAISEYVKLNPNLTFHLYHSMLLHNI